MWARAPGPRVTGPVLAGGYFAGEQPGKMIENAILGLCSQVSLRSPSCHIHPCHV